MFSEEEARNLLSLGRLLPGDEVQLPQGWVTVGSAFATSPSVARPAALGGPATSPPFDRDGLMVALRVLLALTLFFLMATLVLDLALEDSLPEPLRAWRDLDDGDSLPPVFVLLGAFIALIPLLAWFVGLIAAWSRQMWGAHLMLGATLVLAVINMIEPTVMHGVASTCGDLEVLCEGGALALMYFTDVLRPAP